MGLSPFVIESCRILASMLDQLSAFVVRLVLLQR